MKKSRVWRNFILILLFSIVLGLADSPWKLPKLETDIPVITPVWNWFQDSKISLGLDLQGGTQLDYEIDLREANALNQDDDPENDVDITALIDGVKDVIQRRVNSLGVSEANIYISNIGEEKHIVVELPGIENIDEAKNKVGKVVQLEFKTEKESPDESESQEIEKQAKDFLITLQKEDRLDDLEAYAEDLLEPNKVIYSKLERLYKDQLPTELQDIVPDLEVNTFYEEAVKSKDTQRVDIEGRYVEPEGFNIFRVLEKDSELRKRPVNAEAFADLIAELGGDAGETYLSPDEITQSALRLEILALNANEITGVVETENGYYIAQLKDKLEKNAEGDDSPQLHVSHILFKTETEKELKPLKELNEIPEDTDEETRKQLEEENAIMISENEQISGENEPITQENEEIKARNEEQQKKAEEILAQVKEDPSQFAELAKNHSEDSSAEKGGDLGFASPSNYVKEFADASLALEVGEISAELVKSQFGYHIIQLNDRKEPDQEKLQYALMRFCYEGTSDCEQSVTKEQAKAAAEEALKRVREEPIYTVERLFFNAIPSPWQTTDLDGRYFKRADVAYDQQTYRPYVQIQFDSEGAQLFEKLTEANVEKQMAIFVGGEFISAPRINEKISGGVAQITLGIPNAQVALQQANELARSLNAGSIPAPLKKPNELNIGASLGKEALNKSVRAGLIGLLLLSAFMLLYYRMEGLIAIFSLMVYGLFLSFIIESELPPALALVITFVLWISFALNLFRAKMDLSAKMIFLTLSIIGVYFVFSVLITPIVLTLAGVAGLILSIGMAVDANILIFERMKEEFKTGKSFTHTVEDGFNRAWSSILDSNVSTLITCAILYYFGTSVIQGFSINLATGVVISMFSAVTVSRTFLLLCAGTALEKIDWIWKRKNKGIPEKR